MAELACMRLSYGMCVYTKKTRCPRGSLDWLVEVWKRGGEGGWSVTVESQKGGFFMELKQVDQDTLVQFSVSKLGVTGAMMSSCMERIPKWGGRGTNGSSRPYLHYERWEDCTSDLQAPVLELLKVLSS